MKEAKGGVILQCGCVLWGLVDKESKDLTGFCRKNPPGRARHDGPNGDERSRGGGGALSKIKPAYGKQLR